MRYGGELPERLALPVWSVAHNHWDDRILLRYITFKGFYYLNIIAVIGRHKVGANQ